MRGAPTVTASLVEAGRPGLMIQRFRDGAATTGNSQAGEPTRAALTNEICSFLFTYLSGYRVPTFFVEKLSSEEMLVRKLDMLPLSVVIWNVAGHAYSKAFGVKEGTDLTFPVIEHYFKSEQLGNPLVNEFHVYALRLATPDQLKAVNRLASKANVVLRSFFERRGIKLVSVSFEFGYDGPQLVLGSEISPRTCRLFDIQRKGKRDLLGGNGAMDLAGYLDLRNRVVRGAGGGE